jgi:hypothetical protein
VVLNKADAVNPQQLMRVYGAMMWSLGKVIRTPEVVRVYVGSFWDEPYKNRDNERLFQAEQADLVRDLRNLPANSTVRKVNEIVKRARLLRVHAHIIGYLKAQMPSMFGKNSKQDELINNMRDVFQAVQRQYNLPMVRRYLPPQCSMPRPATCAAVTPMPALAPTTWSCWLRRRGSAGGGAG